mgnify:CR=1 FL=1
MAANASVIGASVTVLYPPEASLLPRSRSWQPGTHIPPEAAWKIAEHLLGALPEEPWRTVREPGSAAP